MSRHTARTSRPGSLAAAAALAPAAVLIAAAASAGPGLGEQARWQPQFVTAVHTGPGYQPPSARYVITPNPADAAAAVSRLVAERGTLPLALPPGVGSERGLQVKTIYAKRAISAAFPEIQAIGGVRQDPLKWHPNGLAIDVMIPNYASAEGQELGNRILAFTFANADLFGLDHVIWQQTYYPVGGAPQFMGFLGSDNDDHYNHLHIATVGGGYPTGNESYFG
jgi:hypothetical protein